MDEILVAALRRIVAHIDEIQTLIDKINEKWDYEFLSSDEANDLWEDDKAWFEANWESEAEDVQHELELDEPPDTPRETWALRVERDKEDDGATGAYFENPRVMPDGSWLVHFTNSDPTNIKGAFRGNHVETLGLTKWTGKEGNYGFAFDALDIPQGGSGGSLGMGYGKNAIIFQADAVKAYHGIDGEDQVIFVIDTMENAYTIYGTHDTLELIKDGQSYECKRDDQCVNKIIKKISE